MNYKEDVLMYARHIKTASAPSHAKLASVAADVVSQSVRS